MKTVKAVLKNPPKSEVFTAYQNRIGDRRSQGVRKNYNKGL